MRSLFGRALGSVNPEALETGMANRIVDPEKNGRLFAPAGLVGKSRANVEWHSVVTRDVMVGCWLSMSASERDSR